MSANPLQGIQVINSVNPCSSTSLHRPTYPYYYRGCPPFPSAYSPPLFSSSTTLSLSPSPSFSGFSSLHLPHPSTWNLDSPLPGSTHPPSRLQEKVENCDYKDFSGTDSPASLPSLRSLSSFYRSSLLFPSFRPLLTARNLPVAPLFFPPPSAPSFCFFFFFFYFSFLPVSHGPSHPQFLPPRPRAARSFSD